MWRRRAAADGARPLVFKLAGSGTTWKPPHHQAITPHANNRARRDVTVVHSKRIAKLIDKESFPSSGGTTCTRVTRTCPYEYPRQGAS